MNIVGLGVKDHDAKRSKFNIKAGMIPSRKNTANSKKQDSWKRMNLDVEVFTAEVHAEQMIILSQEELKRVDIDGIMVGTTTQWEAKWEPNKENNNSWVRQHTLVLFECDGVCAQSRRSP